MELVLICIIQVVLVDHSKLIEVVEVVLGPDELVKLVDQVVVPVVVLGLKQMWVVLQVHIPIQALMLVEVMMVVLELIVLDMLVAAVVVPEVLAVLVEVEQVVLVD
jgi:hypothetical protein